MMAVRPDVLWLILVVAAITYLLRVAPLVVLGRMELPPAVSRWLALLSTATLAVFVAHSVLVRDRALALTPQNTALVAALPTFAVAVRTRNLLYTVLTGVAVTAVLRLAIG